MSAIWIPTDVCAQVSLEEYASSSICAVRPGSYIEAIVINTQSYNPVRRLAVHYFHVIENWNYIPDKKGQDEFRIAEKLALNGKLEGDCEDKAAYLAAIAKTLGLTYQFALGKKSFVGSGHAWLEISICETRFFDNKIRDSIYEHFSNRVGIIVRNNHYWLQLDNPNYLKKYKLQYIIEMDGNYIKCN